MLKFFDKISHVHVRPANKQTLFICLCNNFTCLAAVVHYLSQQRQKPNIMLALSPCYCFYIFQNCYF